MQNTVPAGEGAMAAILGLDGETVEKSDGRNSGCVCGKL